MLTWSRMLRAEPEKKPVAPRKKLVAWGGIDWYSPATIQVNIREIERLPFDGTVLQGFKLNQGGEVFDWRCFGKEPSPVSKLAIVVEAPALDGAGAAQGTGEKPAG